MSSCSIGRAVRVCERSVCVGANLFSGPAWIQRVFDMKEFAAGVRHRAGARDGRVKLAVKPIQVELLTSDS